MYLVCLQWSSVCKHVNQGKYPMEYNFIPANATPCLHCKQHISSQTAVAVVICQGLHWICSFAVLLCIQGRFVNAHRPMHNVCSEACKLE